jgi:purine-binding chemotaxis protein CheW
VSRNVSLSSERPTPPEGRGHIVVLGLGDARIALRLPVVERVIRAVAVTPVADAPEDVLGLVNIHGTVIPILDIRSVFGIPRKAIVPTDLFVIAGAGQRKVAIPVEEVLGVVEPASGAAVPAGDILPGLADFIEGAVTLEDGMILIYDLERFLRKNGSFLFDQVVPGVRLSKPDVEISDIRMPKMDGYALSKALKNDPALHDLPVVLLTSLSQSRDIIDTINSRADYYFLKQWDHDVLISKIESILDKRQPVSARPWADSPCIWTGKPS